MTDNTNTDKPNTKLDGISSRKKLNLRQRKFCAAYLKNGGNATAAIKEADYNVSTYGSQRVMASQVRNNPYVSRAIEMALSSQGLTEDKLASTLAAILNDPEEDSKSKISVVRTCLEVGGYIGGKSQGNQTAIQINIGDNEQDLDSVGSKDLYSARHQLEIQLSEVNKRIEALEKDPEIQEILETEISS